MPTLTIVTASTRPGRVGPAVSSWLEAVAKAHGAFDVRIADLGELALPLMDEPNHPMLGLYVHEHTKQWASIVAASDAFVFVTPEYNHSYPATLKNAIDYLHKEWNYKPAGLVSYGGISGGLRAVQAIKPVLDALKMTPVNEAVVIPLVKQHLDEAGALRPDDARDAAARLMLDHVARWQTALAPLRA